jgi:hypothetical protein
MLGLDPRIRHRHEGRGSDIEIGGANASSR